MNRLSILLQLKTALQRGRSAGPKARTGRPAQRPPTWLEGPPPETEDRPPGCGWFDSSWHLHQGLAVTEHATPEAVCNELPLDWWLAWQVAPADPPAAAHPA